MKSLKYLNTNRQGSVLVDAAIVMPIFIMSISLLINLIVVSYKEDKEVKTLCDNALNQTAMLAALDIQDVDSNPKVFGEFRTVKFRPFIGESLDLNDQYLRVYVFPRSGERYHKATCSILKREGAVYELTSRARAEENGYTPCLLCF